MENNATKTFFVKQRIIGFVLYFAVLVALFFARIVFSDSDTDFSAIVIYIVTSALFFVAFFGLSSKNYKLHAQGALIGWLVYFVISMVHLFFR